MEIETFKALNLEEGDIITVLREGVVSVGIYRKVEDNTPDSSFMLYIVRQYIPKLGLPADPLKTSLDKVSKITKLGSIENIFDNCQHQKPASCLCHSVMDAAYLKFLSKKDNSISYEEFKKMDLLQREIYLKTVL